VVCALAGVRSAPRALASRGALRITFVFADVPGLRSAAKLALAEPRVREGVRKRKRIYEERHLGQQ
jgi:hypothetical protein